MIYTVTFNPCLDYLVTLPKLNLGSVNRLQKEEIFPGGKGINVSIVLKNLGFESKLFGFVAGFTGEKIKTYIKNVGCIPDFVELSEGHSRINVKIRETKETELNAQGPKINQTEISLLFEKLKNIKDGDTLVLAGSIPNTLPDDIYEKMLKNINDKNVNIVVDATKDLLMKTLKYKPFVIKPNNHELGEIFGKELKNNDEIVKYAKKLKENGAKNVLVSMAGDGAILVDENDKDYFLKAPKATLINSVGAGDSMVAGFIAGWLKYKNYEDAFKMAVATGSASAFSEWLAKKEDIIKIFNSL